MLAQATKDASADLAEYMCNNLPSGTGNMGLAEETPLVTPFSIVYDVGQGVSQAELTKRAGGTTSLGGTSISSSTSFSAKGGSLALGAAAAVSRSNKTSISVPGGTKEVTAVFNRENRTCHLCTTIIVEDCEKMKIKKTKVKKKGYYTKITGPTCEDIPM